MIYCVDSSADEPIMLINKHIGVDEDGQGIDGAEFQRELLQLDNMGKKRIQVWINCPGGNVIDGMNIFNAILKSKTPVDTYNMGIAASMGGAIFMAGRKRYMADYAKMMVHNPTGMEEGEALKSFKDSCVTMLSSKCNLTDDRISYLMDKETWMGATECFTNGFCTEIETTKESNKKWAGSATQMWSKANKVINQLLIPNTVRMKNVTAKLKLVEDASEGAIVEAIAVIENKLTEVTSAFETEKEEVVNLKKKLAEAENALKLKEEEVENGKAIVNKEKAVAEVANYVKIGKIKNEKPAIEKWEKLMESDIAGTKALLDELPLNKVANKIETDKVEEVQKYAGSAAAVMLNIQNRTQTAVK